jgi:thiamine-phosphate pyrophosphorylase
MAKRQPVLPALLLLSDARNDTALERAIARLPRGSGLVYRHYHLAPAERRARYEVVRRLCRTCGIALILARGERGWRADGTYGAPETLRHKGLRLATAHSLREIGAAVRARADAVLLSPVFATRTHPGGKVLGSVRFLALARRSPLPVYALGGMNRARAARLPVHGWAAIDGLS